ncbi:MAG: TonB-dependent receptor plug domain-containing protein, partial [Candidatus Cloacimonadota bacterium]|nr:TonB-dependent receptor plug domain-containing protein [Candidatus Cloacimonadota bacterium]
MDISRFKQIRIHLVENVFSKMSFLFLIIFLAFYTMLDCIVISGQVVNSSFEPIKLVKVSTTKYSTITDKNGKFSLSIDSFEDSLVFRRYGFEMKKLIANDFYGTRKIQLSKNLVDIEGIEIKSEKLNSILKNSSSKITIKVDNSESISELISSRAGLNIEGIALGGESKQVSFPGFKSRHTLVMIDNIPVNHSGEGFDISSIPLEIIDSIEIVKGASASTFGSGSMGGIVNFITKKGTNNLEISQTVGSF